MLVKGKNNSKAWSTERREQVEKKKQERLKEREKEKKRKKRERERLLKKRKERTYKAKLKARKRKRRELRRQKERERLRELREAEKLLHPKVWWKILLMGNGKTERYVGTYTKVQDAYEALNKLKEESEKVELPVRYLNSGRGSGVIYEYVLFEMSNGEPRDAVLKNEYGKLVPHTTNSDKWNILDKVRAEVEETFWVYGCDPRYERKTFRWIYEHLLLNKIDIASYQYVTFILFGNKVVFKYDDGSLGLVLCKTRSEGIRLYNKVMETVKKDKIESRVFFLGSIECRRGPGEAGDDFGRRLRDELCELTGWDKHKMARMNTIG